MAEEQVKQKQSVFEKPLLSTRIKTNKVTLWPEAFWGYLAGPMFAMIGNGVINSFLIQYWDKVLDLKSSAPLFEMLLPIISAIIIIIGNLLVGRLMNKKPSLAGKARPFILISIPFMVIAELMLFAPWTAPAGDDAKISIGTLMTVAVGYNLYYAFAWPFYYTPHSSLVNLSTRDGNARGLLATAVNAAQLGAAGLAGMFGGILTDALRLLPQKGTYYVNGVDTGVSAYVDNGLDQYYAYYRTAANNAAYTTNGKLNDGVTIGYSNAPLEARADANSRWLIIMIVLIVLLVIGCILEYYFTRERITEEQVKLDRANPNAAKETKKDVSMGQQAKVAISDKYWWFIIIFFFLYQFGGMMKNNSGSFYSQSIDGGTTVSSVINIVGAIPTAVGMLAIYPLSRKFGKGKCIMVGGFIAAIMGCIGFVTLGMDASTAAGVSQIATVSAVAFALKALGTVPGMYISMALMADVLDHEEAVYGIRTDGFTMAVYGSIMVAMAGITNGIIVGINNAVDPAMVRTVDTILFFGVESACYLIIALMFIFMNVERYSKLDHEAIVADQKAKVLAEGGTWVEPEERAKQEEAENARLVEQARVQQLKIDCEKKGLNFDEEEKKYEDQKALKDKEAAEKKAAADKKKAEKEAAQKAKYDALPQAKKDALKAKEDAYNAEVKKDFDAIRLAHKEEREANLFA